jgi:putative membrane protein
VHYAFSGTVGACYAVMADRLPMIRAGHGTAYGTAVWIVADEMVMPLLGLSLGPRQLPVGVHVYALAGHWVYGLTLDSAVRSCIRETSKQPAKRRTAS